MSNSLRISIDSNIPDFESEFHWKEAMEALTAAIKDDSNVFCKVDTGQTQQSANVATNYQEGEVSWNSPYAKYAYYSPDVASTDRNPKARPQWFEAAKRIHSKDWAEVVKRYL